MDSMEGVNVAAGDAHEDIRILRRLDVKEGFTGDGDDADASVAIVLDVETTGIDHQSDAIIQLAMRRFRFDASGIITRIGASYARFEDPGGPIPEEITRLTGIRNEDVDGRRFSDEEVIKALTSASIIIAHHAGFDRKWIERRFPDTKGLPWACSMIDPDWQKHGFEGAKLGFLGVQCGFFYNAHRADVDVDAVIALLRHRFTNGRTALSVMMENAEAPSWFVRAYGAAFEVKDRLRGRGYRWDPGFKVWGKDVRDADRLAEEAWLAAHIYSAGAHARAIGPSFERVTRWDRYA